MMQENWEDAGEEKNKSGNWRKCPNGERRRLPSKRGDAKTLKPRPLKGEMKYCFFFLTYILSFLSIAVDSHFGILRKAVV